MDKFLVAAPPCAGEDPEAPPPPPRRWHRWSRIAVELDGRIDARFRHRELRRLLDSYSEVNRMINASHFAGSYHPAREGVSAMEFDKKVLHKGKTKFHALCSESRKGLTDLAFTSDDKSRLFASGLDGAVYMWDRRLSKTHCIELTALPESQFTSVKLNMDNREQSNIVSSEILSIDFNPSCSYQLAFHLDDGWSGVLNVNTLSVSHLHCPPPSWLEGVDSVLHKRKATWLSTSSIYAVGSSSNNGMYVLDFHPHTSSACHVDYNEETKGFEENQPAENKFIPLSEGVLSCAAHPLSHNIIAGTEVRLLI
ncbi:hypothetical protein ACQ4PT_061380 [Festuca glaucescens]